MNFYALNVTIDTSCLVILLTMIISQIFRRRFDWSDRLFLLILTFNLFNIFAELMAWLLEGYGTPFFLFLQHLFNSGAYLNAGISYTALFIYLINELNGRRAYTKGDKVLIAFTCLPALILILLAMTNFSTHLLFSIGPDNNYHAGPLAKIYDISMFFEQFLLLAAVIAHNEADWKIRRKITVFALMLMAAALLDIILPQIELTYPVMVFVLLVIYLNLLLVVEKQIESTELEIVSGRYNLILAKMRPNFVNMILTNIEELCLEDTEKAQWTISEFSDYLRGNIDKIDRNELIPFEDEIEHVFHYINLIRLKYEDFSFVTDLEVKGFSIPARTILPLAEQFVIAIDADHGRQKYMRIHTWQHNGMIYVDVTGPVMPEYTDIGKGFELYRYVMARLNIVPGADIKLYCNLDRSAHALITYRQTDPGGVHV